MADSQQNPHSGYINRLISPTLPGNTKYCLRFYFSLKGEAAFKKLDECCAEIYMTSLSRASITAGFNQTESALRVYLQHSGGQEKIWTQGEKSKGIWIATDVTFQTSQPAKVRGSGNTWQDRNEFRTEKNR